LIGAALSDNRNFKFPNRDAKTLRNGFELSQLDGEGQRVAERQQQQQATEQYKQGLIKQTAINTGMNASDLRNETASILRQERLHSLFNTPSDGSVFDFKSPGSSPIVDTAREDNASRLSSDHYELDIAEAEIKKQRRIDNKHMVRKALATASNEMARRAMASSSGINDDEQEIPDKLTDDQMTMASKQALQQTSGHAMDTVEKAMRQINKRNKKNQPERTMGDDEKTIAEIKEEITTNGWLKRLGSVWDENGKMKAPSKWTKKNWTDELTRIRGLSEE
jgi:hypothetical protein